MNTQFKQPLLRAVADTDFSSGSGMKPNMQTGGSNFDANNATYELI